jgi:3-hydroxyacyl-CoA dehydrogenase
VMREALWLAENGVATPETVDVVVREGLARGWRHVGPFAAAALGGAATWRRIGANLLPELSDARDLEGLEQWLTADPDVLDSLRRQRDGALAAEPRDSASG